MLDQDGTIDSAAQAIAAAREEPTQQAAPEAVEQQEPAERKTPDRGEDGKWRKAEVEAQASEAEEDDDYLELETEDPETKEKRAERFKVSEVFEGFRKAKELETELQQAKAAKPLPQDYEQAVAETLTERMRYAEALQQWAQYNQPRMPSRDLINPMSPAYNPELYYQQMQIHDATMQDQQRVAQELQRVTQLNQEQQATLERSRLTREYTKLSEIWPELKDRTVATKVAEDLQKHYGVDPDTLKSVSDHRFYALAKDALAYRAAQTAKKEAVKVVQAKPKLVRAGARQNVDGKAAQRQSAFGKLAQSGSLDDAAAAIAALR